MSDLCTAEVCHNDSVFLPGQQSFEESGMPYSLTVGETHHYDHNVLLQGAKKYYLFLNVFVIVYVSLFPLHRNLCR